MGNNIFSRSVSFWGEEKQEILSRSCILIAGVGGLGGVVAQILARSGVGKLIIVDNGKVDEPDLNRQTLFDLRDIGKSKADVAATKLSQLNNHTGIIPLNITIDTDAFPAKISEYEFDGIADCLDNYESRFALENILTEDIFLVHGGVQEDFGQITTIIKSNTQSLKEMYSGQEDVETAIPIAAPIVFCVGSLMAAEIMKTLWKETELANQLLIIELSDFSFSKVELSVNNSYPLNKSW